MYTLLALEKMMGGIQHRGDHLTRKDWMLPRRTARFLRDDGICKKRLWMQYLVKQKENGIQLIPTKLIGSAPLLGVVAPTVECNDFSQMLSVSVLGDETFILLTI